MAEKRYALIIASWDYTADAGLRKLVAPPQDAAALARVLQDPEIGSFEVQTLLNEPSPKVAEEIEAFFAERQRDHMALLYFSGHGVKDTDGQLYFAMPNTRHDRLRSTAIKAQVVNEMMRRSWARQQVLLLDCCYSGAFARGMTFKADQSLSTQEYFDGRGYVILTASDELQYAFEGDHVAGQAKPSVFTRLLTHGLSTGEADLDGDGQITVDELYDYVLDRIQQETSDQKPRKWALDVEGKIVIARNPRPITSVTTLPSTPRVPWRRIVRIGIAVALVLVGLVMSIVLWNGGLSKPTPTATLPPATSAPTIIILTATLAPATVTPTLPPPFPTFTPTATATPTKLPPTATSTPTRAPTRIRLTATPMPPTATPQPTDTSTQPPGPLPPGTSPTNTPVP